MRRLSPEVLRDHLRAYRRKKYYKCKRDGRCLWCGRIPETSRVLCNMCSERCNRYHAENFRGGYRFCIECGRKGLQCRDRDEDTCWDCRKAMMKKPFCQVCEGRRVNLYPHELTCFKCRRAKRIEQHRVELANPGNPVGAF